MVQGQATLVLSPWAGGGHLVVDELLPDEKAFLDKVKHHTTLKASQSN